VTSAEHRPSGRVSGLAVAELHRTSPSSCGQVLAAASCEGVGRRVWTDVVGEDKAPSGRVCLDMSYMWQAACCERNIERSVSIKIRNFLTR
jgi:hypothetical protein